MSFMLIQQLPDEPEDGVISDEILSQSFHNRRYFVGDIICRLVKERNKVAKVLFGAVSYPTYLKYEEILDVVVSLGFTQEIPVYWYESHSESIEKADDENILLVERPFSVGAHVKRDTLTSGNVIAVDRVATVKVIGTNQVISNVPNSKLLPLQHKASTLGSYILHHEWLGIVTSVEFIATLEMADGAQCTFKWTEDMEQVFQNQSEKENQYLSKRILYPGQQLELSKSEMWQVEWNSNIFYGKFRIFKSHGHSSATVLDIESIFTVKWLESLPKLFHERKDKPSEKLSSKSKDWIALDAISKNDNYNIGNFYTLEYWGEKSLQRQTYEEWLQSLTQFPSSSIRDEAEDLQMEQEESLPRVSFCGDNNGENDSNNADRSDALKIWNCLKTTNVDCDLYGKVLTVEVLCTQSCLTVRWPNYVKHIEYFSSCEFEPMIFQEKPTFPLGSVLKFNRKVGSQPQFLEYYGVVVQNDSRSGLMSTNWYKYHPGSKPCYVGRTNSCMEEVELHPEFGKFTPGSIVTWDEMWEYPSKTPLGIVDHMGEDGMLKVKTAQAELSCWPENLVKIPLIAFYNAIEKKWVTENGNFTHICNLQKRLIDKFYPSTQTLSNPARRRGLLLNESGIGIEVIEKCPKFMKFSDLPLAKIQDCKILFQDILKDLKLYTGDDQPGIWIKTFATRQDLISIAMEGPRNTLYEDVLLFFTIKIPKDFPQSPPLFHFHSFSSQEINPCLKTNGKVLLPLLNTYDSIPGFYMEKWDSTESSIGLILVYIRKMILCDIPYRNHRNLEILKLFSTNLCNSLCLQKNWEYLQEILTSIIIQLESPLDVWREEMYQYYRFHIPRFYNRILDLVRTSDSLGSNTFPAPLPSIGNQRGEILKRKLYQLLQVYQQTFN